MNFFASFGKLVSVVWNLDELLLPYRDTSVLKKILNHITPHRLYEII